SPRSGGSLCRSGADARLSWAHRRASPSPGPARAGPGGGDAAPAAERATARAADACPRGGRVGTLPRPASTRKHPMRIRTAALIAAAALAAAACSSEEDQAAKARIFSPEDPPKVLQAAAEKLDAGRLDADPALVDRVFAISAQEAAARLGP